MTFGLYECLRAVGLQCHYARFTSAGVCRAAHLSALTMEDYPHLGVRTMEERTRLFDLVQLIKSLDLDSLGCDDGDEYDYSAAAADEGYAGVNNEFSSGNPDEDESDEINEALAGPSCVRRRLDFSFEKSDRQHKLVSSPKDSVHVHASDNTNTRQAQGEDGCPVVCNCKDNKYKSGIYNFPSDHHMTESMKPATAEGLSMCNLTDRLPSRCVSLQKPKLRSTTASDTKRFGHQNRKVAFRKQSFWSDLDRNGPTGCMLKQTPVYEAKGTDGYNYGLPLSVPASPHKKRVGEQRISVCVRKRPLTRTEKRRKEADVVTNPSGACVIVHEGKEAVDLTQYILQHKFYFDCVFGEESSNEEVYRSTAYPLVQHMLSGGSATCFAYGQTGAGKTYTMLGSSPGRPGLYVLAVQDIFTYLSTTHTHSSLQVYVSFFEIYCGQLYDLLDHRKRLFAREDGLKVVHISGLRYVRVESVNSLLEVIQQGTEVRTQGMSGVNPSSSRSHALLQIQLRDPNQQIAGRMWFVDLAGSERASDTKEPDRQSRLEGAEINQSLLALKECIRSLDKEQEHTPFRQSKLTQVLKDSFVGDSMTCMIANISPGHTATEHTLNTLRYADRVKELKGQRGLRGRRGNKTVPSHKHNMSNRNNSSSSSSSGGTRAKSPTKKPKLGRQNEDIGMTAFTTRLLQEDAIFCSTPKNSRCSEEAKAMDRKEIGLESVTPLRSPIRHGDKKHESKGSCATKSARIDIKRCLYTQRNCVSEQSVRAGPVWEQPVDKQLISCVVQKERVPHIDDLCQTKRDSDLKEGSGEDRKWIELRKRVKTSREISCTAEGNSDRGFQKVDEARKMHLRRYHAQLQQFIPSATSSSLRLCSPSTLSSDSSSVASSSFPRSSCLSVSAQNGLEAILDAYSAKGEVRADSNRGQSPLSSRKVLSQTERSALSSSNNNVDVCESAAEGWRAVQQGRKARCDSGESGTNRLEDAIGEKGGRSGNNKGAGMKTQQGRWAWGATQETAPAERMTGAIVTNIDSQVCCNYDSEDRSEVGVEVLDASDAPADGVRSTEQEEAAGSYSPVSVPSSSLFSHRHLESHPQQAPAERPLSPAHQHTNKFLTSDKLSDASLEFKHNECNANLLDLLLCNTSETVSSNNHRKNKPCFALNASNGNVSCETTSPLSTPITLSDFPKPHHKLSENSPHTAVSPQDNADSVSSIGDPLSISLLQVDQQAATVSFLQGGNNYDSCSQFQDESRGDRMKEVEGDCLTSAEMEGKVANYKDGEFHKSFLELPQVKPHIPTNSDSVTASTQAEPSGMCRIGRIVPPEENNQRPQTTPPLSNKGPASRLKPSTCTSMQTPIMPHTGPQSANTGSPGSHKIMTNARQAAAESGQYDLKNPPASMKTTSAERVSGWLNVVPSKCHSNHSNHSSHSNISLQPNNTAGLKGQESTSNQQMRQTISLFTLDDFDHAKWCVVEAHWEQLKEMETLCRKEGMLLCQQPDMAFGEYVHKLEEIMEKKAECVHNMRAQLQPYLKTIQSDCLHQHGKHNPLV